MALEWLERVQEAVLHGEQGGGGTRGGADLRMDALDVCTSRRRCDAKGAGNLSIRRAAGNQDENLHLSGVRPAGPVRRLVAAIADPARPRW